MDQTCKIVEDLLPLFADGLCSPESQALVEAHVEHCEHCRRLLQAMSAAQPEQEAPPSPLPGPEAVLQDTAWRISRRAAAAAAGIVAIVLYWLVYLWQDALADAGNYRYFSYSFHELYSAGFLLVPLLTLVWLGVTAYRALRRKNRKRCAPLLIVLAVLLLAQGACLYRQSERVSVTSWTEVVEIPDAYHLVIQSGEGPVTLSTTPMVTALVKADGTLYGFVYETTRSDPGEGQLCGIFRD